MSSASRSRRQTLRFRSRQAMVARPHSASLRAGSARTLLVSMRMILPNCEMIRISVVSGLGFLSRPWDSNSCQISSRVRRSGGLGESKGADFSPRPGLLAGLGGRVRDPALPVCGRPESEMRVSFALLQDDNEKKGQELEAVGLCSRVRDPALPASRAIAGACRLLRRWFWGLRGGLPWLPLPCRRRRGRGGGRPWWLGRRRGRSWCRCG